MAIGKVRATLIIVLFATSATIPIIMETAIVPMMNLLNFVQNFATIDGDGENMTLSFKFEALLNSIKRIEVLTERSNENQTVIQLTLNVTNTDPFHFDMLIPGIDMTIFWKAGLPYGREKETVLGWKNAALEDPAPHMEPMYDARRWTRVMGIEINPMRVRYGVEKNLAIRLILYNDETDRGRSNALGQMIGTLLRTQSTKDPYTDETLMHISGSATLDIPGMRFPISLPLGLNLSGFLDIAQLLGGLGGGDGMGTGSGPAMPNILDLLFDIPPNIFDIQNYNDSNGNFQREYSGIDNQTGLKIWTEELFQHGALSAYAIMDLKDQLGMRNLNLTLLKSNHNPDDADVNKVWNPEVGGAPIGEELTANQIFLYISDMPSLINSEWGNKIFGVFGFASEQRIYDYPGQTGDLGDGRIVAGGTLRLTGDLRPNSNFTVGDGLGALISQAVKGVLPIGIFGSIDLMLNQMPLSICLNLPLEVNLTSLLGSMGEEEEDQESGNLFSMLMDYLGFKTVLLNGIAYDTFNSLLQMNMTLDMDMFLPYGIYMPSEVSYDEQGEAIPYLGIAGGPIQIFNDARPGDWDNLTEAQQRAWNHEHLLINLTLDSPILKESFANLMATLGSTGQGDGIAYLFEDGRGANGDYGNLLQFLQDFGEMPNAQDHASNIVFTEDQFKISFKEFAPDFGAGLISTAESMGIDPLFIEYLNNSIPHLNTKTIFEDLLSIRQLLNIISQPGPKNDLYDYLVDANVTYIENATVIDNNTLLVSHDTLKHITSIFYNASIFWDINDATILPNGKIFLNNTGGRSFLETPFVTVEYIASKLDLLDLSNMLGALLNLLFTSESGTGGTSTSDLFSDIFQFLPGTLNALRIDFDRIMPNMINYLRWNISQPEPIGYGIKFFEMLDVAYHALFSSDSDSAASTDTLLSGSSRDLIDNIIKEVAAKFIEQADPFQLMHATINDLTPIMDYLNRSKIFSRDVLIPLIVSLFPSGKELSVIGGESISFEEIIAIILPLIMEMIVGGEDAAFPHEALNPFAWLTSAEAIEYHLDTDYSDLVSRGYSVYQVGMGNWTPDYPSYDYLRLMSNLTLGLLISGFGADDLWAIINQLGLIDLSGGGEEGEGDPFAGLKGLLSLIGSFVPSTEWDSLLRELGIWSTWEGEFEQFDIWITPYIFGIPLTFYFDGKEFADELINLEQLLATGQLMGDEFVQLCLYENQSYGNPYVYMAGYDSSYNTGPYRDMIGINPYGTCDNWGWVPIGWDPGGYQYGSLINNYHPDGGPDYKKSFLSRLISTVPVELDIDVLGLDPIDFMFSFSFPVLWFSIPVDIQITLDFEPQLFMRIRLEGNPSQLTYLFEEQGIPLFGLASHFVGGDLVGLVSDLIASLTGGAGGTGGATDESFEFPELDLVSLLQAFLNAKVDILHYWKFLVDPEFMKASDWYLDSGFVDINATSPTLIWDNDPRIPGDGDEIPDEYPWYRFMIPIYNQINPDLGPSTTAGRNPSLLDYLTPIGPPGSGLWLEQPDGVPDGIQHYWYDTPYAYVNTTVKLTDPWVWIPPYAWNDVPPAGYYEYFVPGVGTVRWGENPGEQVPLLQTAPGVGISYTAWDATGIPSLYFVPSGTSPGVVGSATYYPLPQPAGTGPNRYPNIWNSFNLTLNQTDYRFGYWTTQDDDVLGKTYQYLETKPFYDVLSYAFYPQLLDLLDWIAPLIVDLIMDLIAPSGAGGAYDGSFGYDYYHLLANDSVYSKFGMKAEQALCPIAMLQWLWDGAGTRWNGTHMVPNIEPYTIPDMQGALDWLADRGFTIDFLLRNLNKIFEMFAMDDESGGASAGAVNLAGDLASVFSVESIVNVVDVIEEYFRQVVAQNPDGSPNRTKAAELALLMLKDMINLLDFNPTKAIRGALSYLMPRLLGTGSAGGGSGSSIDANQLDLGTFLEDSGILDLIFIDQSKLSALNFTLAIYDSPIDLFLFGQKIEKVPLSLELNLDLASMFGSGDDSTENGGEGSEANMLNNLPISFPAGGIPNIELSTFNGPFDIEFYLFNTSVAGGRTPVINTEVTIGEVWYNETTGVYIFNRTQSSAEFNAGIWGWRDPDANGIFRTYVRPNSLLRSNGTGMVSYSSVIEEDLFGWVDPYIYIHVEEPNEYTENFYWWNVTGYPLQETLAGNRPAYKAQWIDDGKDIQVQSTNTLPANCIDIDEDDNWEIFAQVEIDGYHMPTHDVVYIKMGNVSDVNALSMLGGVEVQINASHTTAVQTWNVFTARDQTVYKISQEITPTGKLLTYPTISQVISGFHLRANNWNDDSIYSLRVDYVNLTGARKTLHTFQLNSELGANRGSDTYGGTPPAGFSWDLSSDFKSLMATFSPVLPANVNERYGIIDIDAINFMNKTIRSVTIDLTVRQTPEPTGTETTRFLTENFMFTRPSTPRTYFFHEDFSSSEVVIQGSPGNLNTKTATSAWFNYTTNVPDNAFLNGIWWSITANEWNGGSSTSQVAEVIIEYYNATDGRWWRLFHDTPGTKFYTPTDAGYVSPNYLDDWADLATTLRSPHTGNPIGPVADLYLTSRGNAYQYSAVFETVTQIRFAARITESPSGFPEDGIGWTNGTRNFNTSAQVSFMFLPFVSTWGVNTVEIPVGFVNDFTVKIELYDPLQNLGADDTPTVTVNYTKFDSLTYNIEFDDTTTFATKYIITFEAWDSLVRNHGGRGDILYQDNVTGGTQRLVPLSVQPNISTWIEIIDLEAKMQINVTIDAGQTLRNYYLKMNITPALSYEGVGYTSNYRFSIGSENPDALRKIGAYPAKKVLATNELGIPIIWQIGIADLEAFPSQYKLYYILTFDVSPQFLLNTTAHEKFYFTAVWEKAEGSYEIRTEKNETPEPPATIDVVYT